MTKINQPIIKALCKKTLPASLGLTLILFLLSLLLVTTVSAADPDPNKQNISVSSHWVGQVEPSVTVNLLANGTVFETATLSSTNRFKHMFMDLPKQSANGDTINYTVQYVPIAGYTTHMSGDEVTGYTLVHLENPTHAGFTGVPLDMNVDISWIGKVGTKSDLVLFVDGVEAGVVSLTAADGWKHTFSNLPLVANENGTPVTYTVAARNMTGYDTLVSGNQVQGFTVSHIEANTKAVEGSVVSKYVDKDGKEIAYRDTVTGEVGKTYTTTAKTIPGYKFLSLTGNATGTFTAGVQEIVYVYEKEADAPYYTEGTVVVQFVDSKGVEVALRESRSGAVGSDYDVYAKAVNGYKLTGNTSSQKGKFEPGVKTITFVYQEDAKSNESVIGGVVAKYVDENGVELAERERFSGKFGDPYKTTQKTIDGYDFLRTNGTSEGVFREGLLFIEYVYKPTPVDSRIVVKYVDAQGKEIAERVIRAGKSGETYTTEQKKINGYELTRVSGTPSGSMLFGTTTVTYVYQPITDKTPKVKGKVVVKYVDKDGNEIADRTTLTGNLGKTYSAKKKTITGYSYSSTKGEIKGKFDEGTMTVTFVYQEKASTSATNANTGNTNTSNNASNTNNARANTQTPSGSANRANTLAGATGTDASQQTAQDGSPNGRGGAGDAQVQGKALADTATNTYNLLVLGGVLLVAAGVGLWWVNRRKPVTDAE